MRDGIRMLCAGVLAGMMFAAGAGAQERSPANTTQDSAELVKPFTLSMQPAAQPESVYAPPAAPRPDQGVNEGAVHFSLFIGYFTDYIYRGIEIFEAPTYEDSPNLQIDSKLSWDLGKLPHPFITVFVNYADADPISSFQEVRPTLGADWAIRPLVLSAGHTSYIYPDRKQFETSEVWGRIEIDDSYFLRSDKPLLSPYIYAAYDYDRYNGWYFEAGISHTLEIEDTGLTLTASAHVAYVHAMQLYEVTVDDKNLSGLQHYQAGLLANYSINTLFNFPQRYGEWSIQGFVYYTDGIDNDLRANTQVWGGVGLMFKY